MLRTTLSIAAALSVMIFSSCCQPSHKDSSPYIVNTQFQTTYGRDLDLYNSSTSKVDSAYYPIYTFAVQNTGTADDDFTIQLRYRQNTNGWLAGFDITRHVAAGQIVLFKTPTTAPDSITENTTYRYVAFQDTIPNIDEIYYGLSFQSTDSAKIQNVQPFVSIIYGGIDNGPEGCNTPASTAAVNIDSLPVR